MSTTIRVNEDDLKRFNSFMGRVQSQKGENVSQARGFEALLNRLETFEENDKMLGLLIDSAHPRQNDGTWEDGFNAGWEVAIFLAAGCGQDIEDVGGQESFEFWLGYIDEPLKTWLRDRFSDYSAEDEQEND